MLKFYDAAGVAYPLSSYSDLVVTHKLNGCDILSFEISMEDDMYPKIAEECQIDYGDNEWLIKKIDDEKIDCELNFDFLLTRFYKNYNSGSKLLTEMLQAHLPDGWIIENSNIVSFARTTAFDYCTDYDVVMQCMKTYGVYFVWETKKKTITVYSADDTTSTGEYFTDELNLKDIGFKGSSKNIVTRLYCYGKDGLTFADINDGKEYIDNNTYTNKIICGYWTDDRYTNAESLLADGTEKLSALSNPERSYECDVIDLAKLNPDYSFLDIRMHKVVALIDRKRKTRINHRIVEYKEYPDEPDKNVATLSSVPATIQTSVKSVQSTLTDKINFTEDNLSTSIAQSTAMLLNALGGHVLKRNGELLIMDSEDPDTAVKIWRWNLEGLGYSATGINGPYSTAITSDGKIVATMIMAGILDGGLITGRTINGQSIIAGSIYAEAIAQSYKDLVSKEIEETATGKMQQTAEQFNLQFSSLYTGGTNLLRNSSGLNGIDDAWTVTGTVLPLQDTDTKNKTVSNSCFQLKAGAVLSQTVEGLVSGRSYTIVLLCKKTSNLSAYIKLIHDGNETYVLNTSDEFDWTEFSVTIDNVSSSLVFEAYSDADSLYIADIMLTEGTSKAHWTPAPNEIYSSGVKIDRNGVDIYNKDSQQRTKITYAEFAGYYGEDKVLYLNKDETHMTKAIIDIIQNGKLKSYPKTNPADGVNIVLLD